MVGARKLLTQHTQGRRIVYETPYEGVSGVVITPFDYHYNNDATLEATVHMPDGTSKTRTFHTYVYARRYVENRLIDAIRRLRRAS